MPNIKILEYYVEEDKQGEIGILALIVTKYNVFFK